MSCNWDGGCPNINYVDELEIIEKNDDNLVLLHKITEDRTETFKLEFRELASYGYVIPKYLVESGNNRVVKMIVLAESQILAEDKAISYLQKKFPVKVEE